MGLDGLSKPGSFNIGLDPINPYLAANQVKVEGQKAHQVKKSRKKSLVKNFVEEERESFQSDNTTEHFFSEADQEEIILFAKLKGLLNVSLTKGTAYLFRWNNETNLIELVSKSDEQVLLTLKQEEMLRLSDRIERYQGMLSDYHV